MSRTDRRITKLIVHYESLLKSADENVSLQVAERLGDILMRMAELKDRADERQLKREMAELRWVPPAPAHVPAPQSIDETIRQLQREIDAKAQARKKAQAEDIDFFA